MKKKHSRIFLAITGLLTASVILCSQLLYVPVSSISKKEVKTEQTEKNTPENDAPDDLVVTAISQISIPSPSTIEVEKEQAFLFEIQFEQVKTFPRQVQINRSLGKFFLHMFRVIISPNAP